MVLMTPGQARRCLVCTVPLDTMYAPWTRCLPSSAGMFSIHNAGAEHDSVRVLQCCTCAMHQVHMASVP